MCLFLSILHLYPLVFWPTQHQQSLFGSLSYILLVCAAQVHQLLDALFGLVYKNHEEDFFFFGVNDTYQKCMIKISAIFSE